MKKILSLAALFVMTGCTVLQQSGVVVPQVTDFPDLQQQQNFLEMAGEAFTGYSTFKVDVTTPDGSVAVLIYANDDYSYNYTQADGKKGQFIKSGNVFYLGSVKEDGTTEWTKFTSTTLANQYSQVTTRDNISELFGEGTEGFTYQGHESCAAPSGACHKFALPSDEGTPVIGLFDAQSALPFKMETQTEDGVVTSVFSFTGVEPITVPQEALDAPSIDSFLGN